MSNLVINPYVVALFLLVPFTAYLIYLCAACREKIDNLIVEVESGKSKIKYWKEYVDRKEKERKLYTFESRTDLIENVVYWRGDNQQLRLTLDDGSVYVVNTPSIYKLIVQDQTEEGTDK